MATWEDGPEYAPADQPDDYAGPDVAPLDEAPPVAQLSTAPGERPQFGDPAAAVSPLATLVPHDGEEARDPKVPFAVDSDTMTSVGSGGSDGSGAAWGAAHWRPPAGAPAGPPPAPAGPVAPVPGSAGSAAAMAWPPPPAPAGPDPRTPMQLHNGAPPTVGSMPAPGTPAWFGPGPAAPTVQRPPTLWRATPPGVIIVLACSVLSFILPIAPFAFLLGLWLSLRARYARSRIMTAFGVVAAGILVIATGSTLHDYGDFSTWWSLVVIWSTFGALAMIVLILLLVNTELKNRTAPPVQGPPRHSL